MRRVREGLGLTTKRQWDEFCHGGLAVHDQQGRATARPESIPVEPDRLYADEWRGWPWFLGTWAPPKPGRYRPAEGCRDFTRSLGLASAAEWRAYCRDERPDLPARPDDVPAHPNSIFADRWTTWTDWFQPTGGDEAPASRISGAVAPRQTLSGQETP